MLYVTTGDGAITYTADHVINSLCNAKDGYYVPYHIPKLSREVLQGHSANDTVAHVINLFFSRQLTGRDVDLAIGKYPIRLFHMNHRISVIECWHNLDRKFDRIVKLLTAQIRCSKDTEVKYDIWLTIAVRAAVICGAYTQALNQKTFTVNQGFDLAVPSGDFSYAISAWYCRKMGLPIHNIVICSNENNNLWEFINHGQFPTGKTLIHTRLPDCDHTVAPLIEILVFLYGGTEEVNRFRKCCLENRTYFPSDDIIQKMTEGFYVSVVGQNRTDSTIPGVYSTHKYLLGPYCALTYAGALDYRARTGANHHIMLLSEYGAAIHEEYIAGALGMELSAFRKVLDL